jgi:hypothetical protein
MKKGGSNMGIGRGARLLGPPLANRFDLPSRSDGVCDSVPPSTSLVRGCFGAACCCVLFLAFQENQLDVKNPLFL